MSGQYIYTYIYIEHAEETIKKTDDKNKNSRYNNDDNKKNKRILNIQRKTNTDTKNKNKHIISKVRTRKIKGTY